MPKVIISDIFFRKSFDIAAIVNHFFPDCTLLLGCSNFSCFEQIVAKICYRGIPVRLRSEKLELYVQDLQEISRRFRDEDVVFIPAEDQTIRYYFEFKKRYGEPENFKSLLPTENSFNIMCDKARFAEFCSANGFPVPRSYSPETLTKLPFSAYPLVVKPCKGGGSRGVFRLGSPKDLSDNIVQFVKSEPCVVQEFIRGDHVEGAFFLCKGGEVIRAYTHRRLLTSPPQGGVSVLSEYGENSELLKAGAELLKNFAWDGLAMVEYLYNPDDGQYKIIEVNPRIWGSILLSEYSGSHLLVNYINLCLGRELKNSERMHPAYIRWLFPTDIFNIFSKKRPLSWFKFDHTCFINWSYANKWRAVCFNLRLMFSIRNLKRFFRR